MVLVWLDNFQLGSPSTNAAVVVIRSWLAILIATVNLVVHSSEFVYLEYTEFLQILTQNEAKAEGAHSTFLDHPAGLKGS